MDNTTNNTKLESDDASTNAVLGGPLEEWSGLSLMDFWVNNSCPVDIDLADLKALNPTPLRWSGSDETPKRMSIENTGYTINVNAEYAAGTSRPSLDGPMLRCPYEFWCFHFHWGAGRDDGSEHSVTGKRFPTEIHLMFCNVSYPNTDEAQKAEDGVLILVYVCRLVPDENSKLKNLTSNLGKIKKPGKSVGVDPFSLSSLFDDDLREYFMYWSANDNDGFGKLWIVSTKLVTISESQLAGMRSINGADNKCIASNCRLPSPPFRRSRVFCVGRPESAVAELLRHAGAEAVKPLVVGTQRPTTPVCRPNRTAGPVLDLEGYRELPGETDQTRRGVSGAKEKNRKLEDEKSTKEVVIRSIDSLLTDLIDDVNVKSTGACYTNWLEVSKTHREGVRMTKMALERENFIKNKTELKNKNFTTLPS